MATDDENTGAGMGTTGTPNTSGAAAIDDPDQPNGAAATSAGGASAGATGVRGTGTPRTGGAVDDPDLPFDRPPSDDDPVHRAPRYGQR
jgi:hypothetical protein